MKDTITQSIAVAISKAYSGLSQCYQDLETVISESNQRLKKLEHGDCDLEKSLKNLNEKLEQLQVYVEDPPVIFREAIIHQNRRIKELEEMIEALKTHLK